MRGEESTGREPSGVARGTSGMEAEKEVSKRSIIIQVRDENLVFLHPLSTKRSENCVGMAEKNELLTAKITTFLKVTQSYKVTKLQSRGHVLHV